MNSRRHIDLGRGFTLIEMMIVVAILVIVTAIAVPSYRNHVLKTNRSEATSVLLALAAAQEQFYLKSNQYSTDPAELNLGEKSLNGSSAVFEHYSISIESLEGGYRATATAIGGQSNDADCSSFSIDHTGNKSFTGEIADGLSCW